MLNYKTSTGFRIIAQVGGRPDRFEAGDFIPIYRPSIHYYKCIFRRRVVTFMYASPKNVSNSKRQKKKKNNRFKIYTFSRDFNCFNDDFLFFRAAACFASNSSRTIQCKSHCVFVYRNWRGGSQREHIAEGERKLSYGTQPYNIMMMNHRRFSRFAIISVFDARRSKDVKDSNRDPRSVKKKKTVMWIRATELSNYTRNMNRARAYSYSSRPLCAVQSFSSLSFFSLLFIFFHLNVHSDPFRFAPIVKVETFFFFAMCFKKIHRPVLVQIFNVIMVMCCSVYVARVVRRSNKYFTLFF